MTTRRHSGSEVFRYGVLAGLAGGLAEVLWVSLYSLATGGDAAVLARGVTTAAGASVLLPSAPVATGIFVHMTIAMLLGVLLTGFWQSLGGHRRSVASLYTVSVAVLAVVWAMNFFVILPVVSPAFIALVPYPVSLISKLLFGLAAAETLRRCTIPVFAVQSRSSAVPPAGKSRSA